MNSSYFIICAIASHCAVRSTQRVTSGKVGHFTAQLSQFRYDLPPLQNVSLHKQRCNIEFQKWNKKSCSSDSFPFFDFSNISHNCLEWPKHQHYLDTTICVLKINIAGLKVTMCDSECFLLFFLFTYSREKIIGYDKHYCAVACTNSPNEMNPFYQHVPPPCCIILIAHGPLHNWNKQELPSEGGMEGRESWWDGGDAGR